MDKLISIPTPQEEQARCDRLRFLGCSSMKELISQLFPEEEKEQKMASSEDEYHAAESDTNSVNETVREYTFEQQVDNLLAPYKNDPKQRKVSSFFHKIEKTVGNKNKLKQTQLTSYFRKQKPNTYKSIVPTTSANYLRRIECEMLFETMQKNKKSASFSAIATKDPNCRKIDDGLYMIADTTDMFGDIKFIDDENAEDSMWDDIDETAFADVADKVDELLRSNKQYDSLLASLCWRVSSKRPCWLSPHYLIHS